MRTCSERLHSLLITKRNLSLMTGQSTTPIVIDTDNALGSRAHFFQKHLGGDVDDAYAIAYLFSNVSKEISLLMSVGGNTKAEIALENNIDLIKALGQHANCQMGLNPNDTRELHFIPENGSRYLALGPLTNLNSFLNRQYQPREVWMTLGNLKTSGRYPPFWPIEFNATEDIEACLNVFAKLNCNIFVVPLDVARKLKMTKTQFSKMNQTPLLLYLKKYSQRWILRNRILKLSPTFAVWDLVSAIACLHPEFFKIETRVAKVFKNGLVLFGQHNRSTKNLVLEKSVKIVTDFDPHHLWNHFFDSVA